MATKKLTQADVDGVRAPTRSGKQELIWDEGLRGFGLLVSGATNRQSYVCQRKLGGGRTRPVTIGAANVLTLEGARREALAVLRTFAHGVAPKAERRRAAVRDITLRGALDRFLSGRPDLSRTVRQ